MKKWLKILFVLLGFLFTIALVLRQVYLKASYVAEPTLRGNISTVKLNSNGHERAFIWYKPTSITTNAIVFVLHGSTGTGAGVREQTAYQFDQIAEQEGFVVVYPTGYFNHWNDCRGTADYQANKENIDDIAFFKSIETYLNKTLNRTFDYRFATGHSNGGHFCFKLATEAPEWIDGIAPISASMPIPSNFDCQKKGQFVPILLINGTEDPVNPYEGGLVSILGNDSRGTVSSTDETMNYWTQLGNCSTPATKTDVPNINTKDNSTIEKYTWNCSGKTKAILYKVNGGGHTIPDLTSQMPAILGSSNQDINSTAEIWKFFKQQIGE